MSNPSPWGKAPAVAQAQAKRDAAAAILVRLRRSGLSDDDQHEALIYAFLAMLTMEVGTEDEFRAVLGFAQDMFRDFQKLGHNQIRAQIGPLLVEFCRQNEALDNAQPLGPQLSINGVPSA